MEIEGLSLYISTVLHNVAQFLMIPVMLILAALIIYAIFCVASLITEIFTERRYFKANVPKIINDIHNVEYAEVEDVISQAALLKPQKQALLMAIRNMGLSADDLFALAKTELARVDDRYKRTLSHTEQVTKIAPMMGLMATLIPLGPGIAAMGRGDVAALSMSLLIAFDGTVAGLVAAVVALLVTAIRKRWYNQYQLILESLMTCVLDKAEQARIAGIELPHDYYRQDVEKTPTISAESQENEEAESPEAVQEVPAAPEPEKTAATPKKKARPKAAKSQKSEA
jgi:biopolymer transport protein ExbB/TolQ